MIAEEAELAAGAVSDPVGVLAGIEKHGLEIVPFDLSEFEKSGADLSCMVMHLNYVGQER
jgi:N-dimethylarginine dimethylaminohydrolase